MSATELGQAIEAALKANPDRDDEYIARLVYRQNPENTGEWENKRPSTAYVGKLRKRVAIESKSSEVQVEAPPEVEETPPGEQGTEEPTPPPFGSEAFQPPPPPENETEPEKTGEPSLFDGKRIVKGAAGAAASLSGWPGWKLNDQDEEDRLFLEASERMMNKYAPGLIENMGDELMFVVAAAGSMGPRIRAYREHLAAQKRSIPAEFFGPPRAEEPKKEAPPSAIPSTAAPPEAPPPLPLGAKAVGEDEFLRRRETR